MRWLINVRTVITLLICINCINAVLYLSKYGFNFFVQIIFFFERIITILQVEKENKRLEIISKHYNLSALYIKDNKIVVRKLKNTKTEEENGK